VKFNSDEQHAIFAHQLPSALRLTVGLSSAYCEVQQIGYLNIELKLKLEEVLLFVSPLTMV
jgi:hypothetical protein